MAFDFPNSPTVGQLYPPSPTTGQAQYTWDGEKWTMGISSGVAPDTTPPTIVSFSPVHNATNVPLNQAFTITYSENVVAGVVASFRLYRLGVLIETFTQANIGSAVVIAGSAVVITWSGSLMTSTAHEIRVDAGSVKDAAGNPAAAIVSGQWAFTTTSGVVADTTPPSIVSLSPTHNSANVPLNQVFTINYSEPVLAGTAASFRLYRGGTLVETFTQANIGGAVVISGSSVAITWTNLLLSGTAHGIRVDVGSVKDAAGNAGAGLTSTQWLFNTETVATTLPGPTLELNALHDTGTLGDHTTSHANPDMECDFGTMTIVTNGKLYFRVNGVDANVDGVGYHLITAGEATPGATSVTVNNMPGLVAPGVYTVEAKYEPPGGPATNWGTLYTLTMVAGAAYDADATALFAAMTPTPDDARKAILNAIVTGLKVGPVHGTNNWATLRWFDFIGTYAQWSLINWKNLAESGVPTNPGLAPENNPTFETDYGYRGKSSTSGNIDTLVELGNAAPFVQNSASIGGYYIEAPVSSQFYFGCYNYVRVAIYDAAPFSLAQINGIGGFTGIDLAPGTGLVSVSTATGGTEAKMFRNGAVMITAPGTTVSLSGLTYHFGKFGSEFGTGDAVCSCFYIGGERSANMEADMKAVVEAGLTAIGAL